MLTANTLVHDFQRLPFARVPSNTLYAVRKDSPEDAARRAKARQHFLHSNERWPQIDYPQLSAERLHGYASMLVNQLDDVEYIDADEEDKDYIFDAIEQKLHELYRHQKITQMIGTTAMHTHEAIRKRAGDQTFDIFGEMDQARFNYYLAGDRQAAASLLRDKSTKGNLREVAGEFIARTGKVEVPDDFVYYELDAEERAVLREDLQMILPNLGEFLAQDIPGRVPVSDALPYFDRALDVFSLREKGWRSRFTEGTQAEENTAHHTIDVGSNCEPFPGKRLKPLPLHEAIHCFRAQNASEQPNPAHWLASRTNLAFEEGFCTAIADIIADESSSAGLKYYKSLGLQLGLDRHGERRDFRDTYELLWRGLAVTDKAKTPAARRKAKVAAYAAVLRTTRGGAIDARDKSYNDGDQSVKKWLKELLELPVEVRHKKLVWAFSAQFDPTDPDVAIFFKDANGFVG